MKRKKIYSLIMIFVIVVFICKYYNERVYVKPLYGHLSDKRCEIVYSTDDKTYNKLCLYEKNKKIQQKIYKEQYVNVADIIINKETFSVISSEFGIGSTDEFYALYGQPVWSGKYCIIFDGWPINQNSFTFFDLTSRRFVVIPKNDFDEIILSVHENEKSVQILTDHQIYTIGNNHIVDISEYKFNQNINLGYCDYAETNIFKYFFNEKYIVYPTYTYIFDNNRLNVTDYNAFISFYSFDDDTWYCEKIINKIVLNYFIENDKLYVICVEDNGLNKLEILKYNLSYNKFTLEKCYTIDIPKNLQYIQDNNISITHDYIIYFPYNFDGDKMYIILIEKDFFTVSFSGYIDISTLGGIYNISISDS